MLFFVGSGYLFCMTPKQKVHNIAMAVLDVQSQYNLRTALTAMALPVVQALGCVARVGGRVELQMLPVVRMICGFVFLDIEEAAAGQCNGENAQSQSLHRPRFA